MPADAACELSIRRDLSADHINLLANHPGIRPWVGEPTPEPLDLSAAVGMLGNVALRFEGGAFLCMAIGEGVYEVHSLVLPEMRGAPALEAAQAATTYMFASTDCVELVTRVPEPNRAALGLARAMGFRKTFTRIGAWPCGGEDRADISHWSLTLADWAQRSPAALAAGAQFHERLERAKRDMGSSSPVHADDEAHDRAVGASILMGRAGNVLKAVQAYNRWAVQAGYQGIALISEHPPLVDIVDAILELRADSVEILLCR